MKKLEYVIKEISKEEKKMKLVRDKEEKRVKLINDEEILLLDMGFIFDEFVYIFHTHDPIIITEEVDSILYSNLQDIMDCDYEFTTDLNSKTDKEVIWFSDKHCDLEDKKETDKVNRLVIRKENEAFVLSHRNPYFEKNNIKRSMEIVEFSPQGNGNYSKNLATGSTFQDDIIKVYWNIMYNNPYKFELNKK